MGKIRGSVGSVAAAICSVILQAVPELPMQPGKIISCSKELVEAEINSATWKGALFGHGAHFSQLINSEAKRALADTSSNAVELFEQFPELTLSEVKSLARLPDSLLLMQQALQVLLIRQANWQEKLLNWVGVQTHFPWQHPDDVGKDFMQIKIFGVIAYRLLYHRHVEQLEISYNNALARADEELSRYLETNDQQIPAAINRLRTAANTILLLWGWLATYNDADLTVRPSAVRALLDASRQDDQARRLIKYLHIDDDTLSYGSTYTSDESE